MAERSLRIEPEGRAQLMLVGAVALALVIVGIVVVYNTVLYSSTQSATGTIDDARQAEAFTQQVRKEVGILGGQLEAANNLSQDNLSRAIGNWSQVQMTSHANTDPVFVEIDLLDCSTACDPGSNVTANVTWQSGRFSFENEFETKIHFPDVGSTVYAVQTSDVIEVDGDNGAVSTFTMEDAEVIGPRTADLDGDGFEDFPYVVSSGDVKITNGSGSPTTIADDAVADESYLAVGTWNGSSTSVFFANDSKIFRANANSTAEVINLTNSADGVQAVLGIADVDNDSEAELVHVDGSQTVRYVDQPVNCGASVGSCTNMSNGDVQNDPGIGAGAVADFDGDGKASVVATDTTGPPATLKLIGAGSSNNGENTVTISSVSDMAASPPTVADVDSDGLPEIVYVNDGGFLKYVDDVRNGNDVQFLRDEDGNKIDASKETGVGGS